MQKWAEELEAVARNRQQFRTVVAFIVLISFFYKKRTGIIVQ